MTIDVRAKPASAGPATDLALPPRLRAILAAEYPRFSEAEMARRRAAVGNLLAEFELDHLVYCGANRFGSAVQWLTGWPVTAEAVGVLTPKIPDALFIQHINHVPLARRLAAPRRWPGAAVHRLPPPSRRSNAAGRARDRVGVIGPMTFEQHAMLAARFGAIANLNRRYVRLRQIKSAEEIDWMRIGAALTDRGMAALRDGLRPGLTERSSPISSALLYRARRHQRHSLLRRHADDDPSIGVPTQFVANRTVKRATLSLPKSAPRSGNIPGRCSQFCGGCRTVAALPRSASAPTPLSMRLPPCSRTDHAAAIIDAASVIEQAGFTIIDDLLHGYGGGYLPPVLGSQSRPAARTYRMSRCAPAWGW